MAGMYDAAARLAEGRTTVEIVQSYVWACHLLGYSDADLTLHAAQVRDWYSSEDGLDLRALDADCAALTAAAVAAEEALARQDAQAAALSAAWQGAGASASHEFLRRHAESSRSAAAAVRSAAESLEALRDRLWRAVDGKVTATTAVEGGGRRDDWRAAAETVISGTGDRAVASELVDQEVKPFVVNEIRVTWLEAMRSAVAEVVDAYDAAVAAMGAQLAAVFDVPSDLGPTWTPSSATTSPAGVSVARPDGVSAVPAEAAWSPQPAASSVPVAPPPPSAAVAPVAPPPAEPAALGSPPMPSVPSLGGAMPDLGSGLSGFGQQLGDMLGGLLGSADDGLDEPPELEKPDLDEPDLDEPLEVDEEDPVGVDEEEPQDDPACEVPSGDEPPAEPEDAEEPPVPVEPAPTPPPEPLPPAEPLPVPEPPPEPLSAAETPCEIAANELPQVGE